LHDVFPEVEVLLFPCQWEAAAVAAAAKEAEKENQHSRCTTSCSYREIAPTYLEFSIPL
jgi:hypothetical protein